jgi:hypothetical protein
MLPRISGFLKNFVISLGRCIIDGAVPDIGDWGEGFGGLSSLLFMMAICAFIACAVYGLFQVGYEVMFDPNATNVASRLADISISPEKWM